MRRYPPRGEKPLLWVGSSKRDLLEFPEPVVDNIGYAFGIRTARTDVDRIGERLKAAQLDYEARYGKEEN